MVARAEVATRARGPEPRAETYTRTCIRTPYSKTVTATERLIGQDEGGKIPAESAGFPSLNLVRRSIVPRVCCGRALWQMAHEYGVKFWSTDAGQICVRARRITKYWSRAVKMSLAVLVRARAVLYMYEVNRLKVQRRSC